MILKRRRFIAFAPLIFIPRLILADDRRRAQFNQQAAAAAACTTARDTEADADVDFVYLTSTATDYAAKFVAGATATICKAQFKLKKASGSPMGQLKAQIYSDSAGTPSALVGTASDGVASSTLTGTATVTDFVNMSASITSGTTYWALITTTGEGAAEVGVTYAGDTTAIAQRDSGSWNASYFPTARIKFNLFS